MTHTLTHVAEGLLRQHWGDGVGGLVWGAAGRDDPVLAVVQVERARAGARPQRAGSPSLTAAALI